MLKFLAGDGKLKPLTWVFKDFQVYYTVHCSQSDSPAEISAEGGLTSGSIDTAAYCTPTTDAVGWTLQWFHAAVSLDIQVFQSPALPAFPKFHLNLTEAKKETKGMSVELISSLNYPIRKKQGYHTTEKSWKCFKPAILLLPII